MLDRKIQEEADELVSEISTFDKKKASEGKHVPLATLLSKYTNNVMSHVVFGHPCSVDSEFQSVVLRIHELFVNATRMSNIFVMVFFPYVFVLNKNTTDKGGVKGNEGFNY